MYDIYQQSALGVKKCKVNMYFAGRYGMIIEGYITL